MNRLSICSSFVLLLLLLLLNGCVGYNHITKSEIVGNQQVAYTSTFHPSWQEIQVYDDEDLFLERYKVLATIAVTGNDMSSDGKLIEKMQKEASRYRADAIIFKRAKEIERNAVNGFAIGFNILSIFSGGWADFNMGGRYVTYKYEGIAIKFLE